MFIKINHKNGVKATLSLFGFKLTSMYGKYLYTVCTVKNYVGIIVVKLITKFFKK